MHVRYFLSSRAFIGSDGKSGRTLGPVLDSFCAYIAIWYYGLDWMVDFLVIEYDF